MKKASRSRSHPRAPRGRGDEFGSRSSPPRAISRWRERAIDDGKHLGCADVVFLFAEGAARGVAFGRDVARAVASSAHTARHDDHEVLERNVE